LLIIYLHFFRLSKEAEKLHFNGELMQTLRGHTSSVMCLGFLSKGRLASGSADGQIIIWNAATSAALMKADAYEQYNGENVWVTSLVQLNDDLLVSGSSRGEIKTWNLAKKKTKLSLVSTLGIAPHTDRVSKLVRLANGNLASASYDKTIKVWKSSRSGDGVLLRTIQAHEALIECLLELTNGNLVSGSFDKNLKIWNESTGELVRVLKGHRNNVTCAVQIDVGRLASSGDLDGSVIIWSLETGDILRKQWCDISCFSSIRDFISFKHPFVATACNQRHYEVQL
jgi:WD40 repeat protein